MKHRLLGHTGTAVTSHCLGTMTFGSESSETQSRQLLELYLDSGGNFIDTADVYTAGASEEIIGRWLRDNPGQRDHIVLATKGRFPVDNDPNGLGLSRRHLRQALDASLTRLQTDWIDLYQVHAWDALTPIEETLEFLDDARRAGKILYSGVSNFLGWQITKAVHVARAHNWAAPVTAQMQYNLLTRDIEHEVVPAAADGGLGILTWSPLAGGWLTGKYRQGERPTGATRLGENPARGMEAYDKRATDHTWAVLDAVAQIAREHGASQSQVSLAWLEAQPGVTSVILGARTPEQLADNLGAFDLELTPAELASLTAVSQPAVSDYPYGAPGIAQRHRKIQGGR